MGKKNKLLEKTFWENESSLGIFYLWLRLGLIKQQATKQTDAALWDEGYQAFPKIISLYIS